MSTIPGTNPTAQPNVSVLIPVFNGERFIVEAVESVLLQDYSSYEIVIVNDGSTDKTQELLDAYRDDPRVVIVRNASNMGLVYTLNIGLDTCRGAFVARLDADDTFCASRLRLQVELFGDDPDLVLVASGYQRHSPEGGILVYGSPLPTHAELAVAMLLGNRINHASVMFRLDLAIALGGYREDWFPAEDYDLWLRMIEVGTYRGISDVLVHSLNDPGGISISRSREQQQQLDARSAEYGRTLVPRLGLKESIASDSMHASVSWLSDWRGIRQIVDASKSINVDLIRRGIDTAMLRNQVWMTSLRFLRSRGRSRRHLTILAAAPTLTLHAFSLRIGGTIRRR